MFAHLSTTARQLTIENITFIEPRGALQNSLGKGPNTRNAPVHDQKRDRFTSHEASVFSATGSAAHSPAKVARSRRWGSFYVRMGTQKADCAAAIVGGNAERPEHGQTSSSRRDFRPKSGDEVAV